MSRWRTAFTEHPFQAKWNALKDELAATEVDDQTVQTSVDELARLKKVVAYLETILANIDADLTPKAVWDNFHSQLDACLNQVKNYKLNKNIAHIVQANEHADNLLSYVKPYFVLPPEVVAASRGALDAYASQMEAYVASFVEKARVLIAEISEEKNQSNSYFHQTKTLKKKIEDFHSILLVGSPEKEAVANQINKTEADITAKAQALDLFHSRLLVGDESVQSVVTRAKKDIENDRDAIGALLNDVNEEVNDLHSFHTKIFGQLNESTGQKESGLAFELAQRQAQLSAFEIEQKTRQETLFTKIESLLPGATSAGLATAYRTMKDGFTEKITLYTRFFYGALGALVFAAILMSVKKFSVYPTFGIEVIEVPDWDFVLKALLYKVPFVAPAVWLAIFSTTRRSQYERLQQEYAHKEALAASYESYKKQLQELNIDSEALQKELISKAIEAISYNASTTLDGKHEDKTPFHQFIDKLTSEDLKNIREFFKPTTP